MRDQILDGRFALGQFLGEGSVGPVYEATDRLTGTWVAVKFDSGAAPRRFKREVEILQKLAHPNVMPLLHVGNDSSGTPYYVMERMASSLEDCAPGDGPMSVAEALEWGRGLLRALVYCSLNGVIHRDVKPANLFRAADGRIVLGDYSSALDESLPRLTLSDAVVRGTPPYVSPELASGRSSANERTEVYSVGCVLYEALGGALPGPATGWRPPGGEFPPLGKANPDVPAWLSAVVAKAMSPVPIARFPSTADLLFALDETLLTPPAKVGATPSWSAAPLPDVPTFGQDASAEPRSRRTHEGARRSRRSFRIGGPAFEGARWSSAIAVRPARQFMATLTLGFVLSMLFAATVSDQLGRSLLGGGSNPFAIFSEPFRGVFGGGHGGGSRTAPQKKGDETRPKIVKPIPTATGSASGSTQGSSSKGAVIASGVGKCTCGYGQIERESPQYGGYKRESTPPGEDGSSEKTSEPASKSVAPAPSTSPTEGSSTNSRSESKVVGNESSITEVNGKRTVTAPPGAEVTECATGATVKTATETLSSGSCP